MNKLITIMPFLLYLIRYHIEVFYDSTSDYFILSNKTDAFFEWSENRGLSVDISSPMPVTWNLPLTGRRMFSPPPTR